MLRCPARASHLAALADCERSHCFVEAAPAPKSLKREFLVEYHSI